MEAQYCTDSVTFLFFGVTLLLLNNFKTLLFLFI